jgi:hypothetical protein
MSEKLWIKISWLLPRKLVYWACIRLIAHATTGKFSNQIVPELTAMDALERWE